MDRLKDIIRQRLSKRKINKISMWYFCIKIVESYFDKKYVFSWYIKNSFLFIKPKHDYCKLQVFLNKQKILQKINNNLLDFWYNQNIINIIFI